MPSSDIVVVNTTPLLYLASIDQFELLRTFYQIVYLPEAVGNEILAGGSGSFGFGEFQKSGWIKTRAITNTAAKNYLLIELDEGEAEVIVLAEELHANLIILDDNLARQIARLRGFKITGTLGILMAAKQQGLLPAVKPFLDRLRANGFWLNTDLYNRVLTQVGE